MWLSTGLDFTRQKSGAEILLGLVAGSIALIGFGLDSIVESLSAAILIWRLRQHDTGTREEEGKNERTAQRFVAVTFFILGLYVLYESAEKLIGHEIAQPSPVGILIAIASILIMPILVWKKQAVGTAIGSKALIADPKETLTCAFLSVTLLASPGANYLFGFWQADPVVGIIIVLFLFRKGYEGWAEAGEEGEDEQTGRDTELEPGTPCRSPGRILPQAGHSPAPRPGWATGDRTRRLSKFKFPFPND
ncbi:MAG: cation transporter [Deltaproteobacteria bacterium]|nr:cation transporter [Deltaproteobacteria bacterium]